MFWRRQIPIFGDVARQVLRLKETKSKKTRQNAKLQIGRLIKNFGELPLAKLSENDWIEYVARELRRRERTFFDDRKYMRMILRFGELRGLLKRQIELPIPDLPWNTGLEICQEELVALKKHAGPILKFQIEIAYRMGLRLREMLRLRWDQFDWEKSTIRFLPADTKTRRGRQVAVTPVLLPQFKARRAQARCAFVFPSPTGVGPQNDNKTAWRRCKAKAGIKVRWHDLRHTCASVMLRRGIRPEVVRRYLGMSELVLTRIYTHLSVEDLTAAAAAMNGERKKKVGKLAIGPPRGLPSDP